MATLSKQNENPSLKLSESPTQRKQADSQLSTIYRLSIFQPPSSFHQPNLSFNTLSSRADRSRPEQS